MGQLSITAADSVEALLKGSNSRCSPGIDKLHKYWWKHLTSVHKTLSKLFQKALSNPSVIPNYFTSSITYLIPKDSNEKNPKNSRILRMHGVAWKVFSVLGNLMKS